MRRGLHVYLVRTARVAGIGVIRVTCVSLENDRILVSESEGEEDKEQKRGHIVYHFKRMKDVSADWWMKLVRQ